MIHEQARFLDTAEVAKLVRKDLSKAFPCAQFSVRTKKYSGGSAVYVNWTDGPTTEAVDAICKKYEGKGFDSSIDLSYFIYNWLLPDGTMVQAKSSGTQQSMGTHPAFENPKPHPKAELVFCGCYVSTQRSLSLRAIKDAVKRATEYWGDLQPFTVNEQYACIETADWRTQEKIMRFAYQTSY